MQCKFTVDVGVNPATLDAEHHAKIAWRPINGGRKMEAYFPAGTVYAHPNAAFFVDRGMALPDDAECEAAIRALTPEQRRRREAEYQADAAGVHDPGDRELFFAGVITGYKSSNGPKEYVPGPNWDAYQRAREAAKADEEV